jgi:hypothetical protein
VSKQHHPHNRQERILLAKKKAKGKGDRDGIRRSVVEQESPDGNPVQTD